ncbi:MAG: hypothetical protein LLG04_18855 [Parachlamydia sp.]|nr:hypothetical protein [Parachlamydia sp.]
MKEVLEDENVSVEQFRSDIEVFRKGLEMCEEISEEVFSKHFDRSEEMRKLIYIQAACLHTAKMIAKVPDKNFREDLVNNIVWDIDYYLKAKTEPNVQDESGK